MQQWPFLAYRCPGGIEINPVFAPGSPSVLPSCFWLASNYRTGRWRLAFILCVALSAMKHAISAISFFEIGVSDESKPLLALPISKCPREFSVESVGTRHVLLQNQMGPLMPKNCHHLFVLDVLRNRLLELTPDEDDNILQQGIGSDKQGGSLSCGMSLPGGPSSQLTDSGRECNQHSLIVQLVYAPARLILVHDDSTNLPGPAAPPDPAEPSQLLALM